MSSPTRITVNIDRGRDGTSVPVSTDGTFAANSDLLVPSQKSAKTFFNTNVGTATQTALDAAVAAPAIHNKEAILSGASVSRSILDRFEKDGLNFADHIEEADATDMAAVSAAFTEAKTRAAQLGRAIEFKEAIDYHVSDVSLANVAILAAPVTHGPYESVYGVRFIHDDKTKPIFKIGRNVAVRGVTFDNLDITDAAASAAITAASAVTPAEIKAALEAEFSAEPMIKTFLGNFSNALLEDITVPACWDFMKCGDTAQYYVMGAVGMNRLRVFSMHRDFLGYSSAEANDLCNSLFSFSVSGDRWGTSNPVVSYVADWGAFLEVVSASSYYNSFDGFNLSDVAVFAKRYGLLITNGALNVSRVRSLACDGVGTALSIGAAGRVLNTTFEIDAYSYRYPSAYSDADYATRNVIEVSAVDASTDASQFTLDLKSDYSSGPIMSITGDLAHKITGNINGHNFGSEGTGTAISAVKINNTNANVTMDLKLHAPSGNTAHSGLEVTAGKFTGHLFADTCKNSYVRGGANENTVLISPVSKNTVTADVTSSGGGKLQIIGSSSWSNQTTPAGLGAVNAYLAANQTFNNATPTVVLYATEVFDADGCFASNTYTAAVPGLYEVVIGDLLLNSDGTVGERWGLELRKNGTSVRSMSFAIDTVTIKSRPGFSSILQLAASDTLDVVAFRAAGAGQITFVADGKFNHLYVRRL